ncbi:MAG: hypothetical protein MZU97_11345 [Bacillus subtilis]|nr:hypothetical protein [Bacillus subtilis]
MRILVTNDDGYEAVGIRLLAEKMKKYGDVTLVAPHTHMSGASVSRGGWFQSKAYRHADDLYSVEGTPADAVHFADLRPRPQVRPRRLRHQRRPQHRHRHDLFGHRRGRHGSAQGAPPGDRLLVRLRPLRSRRGRLRRRPQVRLRPRPALPKLHPEHQLPVEAVRLVQRRPGHRHRLPADAPLLRRGTRRRLQEQAHLPALRVRPRDRPLGGRERLHLDHPAQARQPHLLRPHRTAEEGRQT